MLLSASWLFLLHAYRLLSSPPVVCIAGGAAGITIAPLDQDFPWFSIARVQFFGRDGQASTHTMNGVVGGGLAKQPTGIPGVALRSPMHRVGADGV